MGTNWEHDGYGCPERLQCPGYCHHSFPERCSPYRSLQPQGWHCTLAGPTALVLAPSNSWWLSLWW